MAVDDALLAAVQEGSAAVLRLYLWEPACLSFGRNQTTSGIYDRSRLEAAGIDTVRRPTGGLAVLHDRELTYSVAVPADLLGGPRTTYETINRALVAGLRELGVAATLAPASQTQPRPHDLNPCFHAPATGEVMAADGKLVGSAQRCERRTILQHGSILVDGNQADLVAYQIRSSAVGEAGITLRTLLGSAPTYGDVGTAVVHGFERVMGTRLAPSGLSDGERSIVAARASHYADPAWTWRR